MLSAWNSLPFIVAAVVGWWQPILRAGFKMGLIAGALFAAANMAVLWIWSAMIIGLGRVTAEAQTMGAAEEIFEAFHMSLAYVLVGSLFGMAGRLLGAGTAGVLRRMPGGHRPGSPTAAGSARPLIWALPMLGAKQEVMSVGRAARPGAKWVASLPVWRRRLADSVALMD